MALINSTAIPSGATGYELEQSLRFDRAGVSYLSKNTVATSAGRKKFTISLWFKLGIVASGTGAFFRSEDAQFTYEANGKISCLGGSATSRTAAVFRDPNSWYHVVFAVDTTQGTASNRVKIYINGVHSPSENTSFPGQNVNVLGASGMQYISSNFTPGGAIFDGYMAEYHFLDTIAATPSDFGKTGTYGEWKPIEYSGSYGTNGFYQKYVTGGHTSFLTSGTYTAPAGVTSVNYLVIGGGGGGGSRFGGGGGAGGYRTGTLSVTAGNSYSVTVGAGGAGGVISGGSGTSGAGVGTNGGSSVFSSITSTGGGGGGAGDSGDGANGASGGGGAGRFASGGGSSTSYGSDGGGAAGNSLGGDNYRAAGGGGSGGIGSNGSTPGTGGAGTASSITGLSITRAGGGGGGGGATTSYSGGAGGSGGGGTGGYGIAGTNGVANTGSGGGGGGYFSDGSNRIGGAGGSGIVIITPPSKDFGFGADSSGNGNNFIENNFNKSDQMLDSPTNNFATMNPLDKVLSPTLSEGNLKSSHGNDVESRATMYVSSGKWYWENCVTGGSYGMLGITKLGSTVINYHAVGGVAYYQNNGNKYVLDDGSAGLSYGASYTTGDIIGIAYNADDNEITFYKNNVSQGTITSIPDNTYAPSVSSATSYTGVINFGQDSSFAGNKTAQGNQDGNDIGDFYYTPPTGFLALCTSNLPDVAVIPSEHFNTVLYTGNGTTGQSITGVGFQSDFLWAKARASTTGSSHRLFDSVRGVSKQIRSNSTGAEGTDTELTSFDSDGFTIDDDGNGSLNDNNIAYVAWNWKANGSGSSNTDGSTNSTVSANTDAGFSIVSYTGASGAQTIGHGLSLAPEMIIVKNRDSAQEWVVMVEHCGNADFETDYIRLDTNGSLADNTFFNDTKPTNSLFSVGDSQPTNSGHGNNYIAYCFHSVEGFSKLGFFVGNSSTDGVFTYCGFSPRYIIIKKINAVNNWYIYDTARTPNNVTGTVLLADSSNAEATQTYFYIDILSNGFKARTTDGALNASAGQYTWMAFAETPFKYSNAR